jgi:hypothetical protein
MVYAGGQRQIKTGFLPNAGSIELCKIASLRNSMTGVATLVAGFGGPRRAEAVLAQVYGPFWPLATTR